MIPWESAKVLFITPQPFLVDRGSPLRVKATVEAIAASGAEVELLALPFGETVVIPGVILLRSMRPLFVHGVPIGPSIRKFIADVFLFFSALSLVIRRKYDAIHGVEEGWVIGALLGRLFHIPYVVDMHSSMSQQLERERFWGTRWLMKLFEWIEVWALKHASAVVTVSARDARRAADLAPGVPTVVAKDTAGMDFPAPDQCKVDELSARINPEQRTVLVYTGNFAGYQGIPSLLSFFASYVEEDSVRPLLVIVGGENERMIAEYQELCQQLGIGADVWFEGQQPSDEIASYLAFADVLVSPRLYGSNTPMKIYSYLAAGKPVVASRIEAHEELRDVPRAFLFDLTAESFCSALNSAIECANKPASATTLSDSIVVELTNGESHLPDAYRHLYNDVLHICHGDGGTPTSGTGVFGPSHHAG